MLISSVYYDKMLSTTASRLVDSVECYIQIFPIFPCMFSSHSNFDHHYVWLIQSMQLAQMDKSILPNLLDASVLSNIITEDTGDKI